MLRKKLALMAPAGAMHRFGGNFGHSLHYAPLTLTTLAAIVPEELGFDITIYDETVGSLPLYPDADIICLTAITGTAPRTYAFADRYRALGHTVILGGVHPTLMPMEAKEHADAVVTGFGENTFPALLGDWLQGQLQPFYHQESGEFNIAGRPIPKRELLNKRGYITKNTVEAVRGCSLPCTFCAYPAAFGSKIHPRPVEEVVAEVAQLKAKIIVFPDVNLIASRRYALELFKALEPLKIIWLGLATSSVGLDDELITAFRRSGCRGLLIGMESVVQESQAFVNKGVNKGVDYIELMKRLHDNGILVQGCFAFGGDEEGPDVFDRTVELCLEAKVDLPRFSILTPFPGTKYYHELKKEGRIFEHNWAMYDVEHVVFQPKKMTVDQLHDGTIKAWREIYSVRSVHERLKPYRDAPWLSIPLNLGYKGYADKLEYYTREIMCDNSDVQLEEVLASSMRSV